MAIIVTPRPISSRSTGGLVQGEVLELAMLTGATTPQVF
jgi:hypothetical protein